MEYVPVTYKGLNANQKVTADILVKLFSERNLKPKYVLGSPSEAHEAILKMAGNDVTLERLRRFLWSSPSNSVPAVSIPTLGTSVPPSGVQPVSVGRTQAFPESEGSSNAGGGGEAIPEVSSLFQEEIPPLPQHLSKKHQADDASIDPKRPRVSEGATWEFCSMDRSFDALGFIEHNLLAPRAQEVLKDYDPIKSIRWAEWASLRAATIMKSIEPRLTATEQWENRCAKLNGDLKMLNLQKIQDEKERAEAEQAKLKAEGDLKSVSDNLKTLKKERDLEIERRKDKETELDQEIRDLQKLAWDEKARADKAEASLGESEKGRLELVQMAQDSVAVTERALKAQISSLLPDFDVSQLGAFKD
ncbi:hypothetical protein PIB30_097311 [Stylosanthes scabra]|uniref:Uncharacterized protein n=1 Tax=Stylosanthes scabra TaxID=79078 RepID=A0ABU6UVV7_9FABA|nr:hypothetical protein [Stylosanthes scabra]